ncbi:DUF6235 family protein [Actinophytocola sp.]|uniref:DUF6235 family protein n=1 Tax=Actinophytocola sp. TaxID=1872138 RepID=UPI002D7FFBD3|nr:DUF6235 family protein [Actinophytocola sp.]HET9141405.1 DUF6235 family protein [Actinophytocola sp.]
MAKNYRLTDGTEQLDAWSEQAGQAAKNALYKALFAVTDGSVFRAYGVLPDRQSAQEHFVLVREDLVLKVSFTDEDAFAIRYIGALDGAPGLDLSLDFDVDTA